MLTTRAYSFQSHLRVLKLKLAKGGLATGATFNRTWGYWNVGKGLERVSLGRLSIAPEGMETCNRSFVAFFFAFFQSHLRVWKPISSSVSYSSTQTFNRTWGYGNDIQARWSSCVTKLSIAPEGMETRNQGSLCTRCKSFQSHLRVWKLLPTMRGQATMKLSIAPEGMETRKVYRQLTFARFFQSHLRVWKLVASFTGDRIRFAFNRTWGYGNIKRLTNATDSNGLSIAPEGMETWCCQENQPFYASFNRTWGYGNLFGSLDCVAASSFNRTWGYGNKKCFWRSTSLVILSIAPEGMETRNKSPSSMKTKSFQSHLRVWKHELGVTSDTLVSCFQSHLRVWKQIRGAGKLPKPPYFQSHLRVWKLGLKPGYHGNWKLSIAPEGMETLVTQIATYWFRAFNRTWGYGNLVWSLGIMGTENFQSHLRVWKLSGVAPPASRPAKTFNRTWGYGNKVR